MTGHEVIMGVIKMCSTFVNITRQSVLRSGLFSASEVVDGGVMQD